MYANKWNININRRRKKSRQRREKKEEKADRERESEERRKSERSRENERSIRAKLVRVMATQRNCRLGKLDWITKTRWKCTNLPT